MRKTVSVTVIMLVDYETEYDDIMYDLEELVCHGMPGYVHQVDIAMPEEQMPE